MTTHCQRCGRLLTHKDSVFRKIGPVCYAKLFGFRLRKPWSGETLETKSGPPFKGRSLLEIWGPHVKDVEEQSKFDEFPEFGTAVKEAVEVHEKAKKSAIVSA